jgi:hypothetical protein
MGDLMNEFMKKKAISMLRMELIITLIYIGAWGIWGIMAIVDLNVAKIFFLGMSIYITLIIHYHGIILVVFKRLESFPSYMRTL